MSVTGTVTLDSYFAYCYETGDCSLALDLNFLAFSSCFSTPSYFPFFFFVYIFSFCFRHISLLNISGHFLLLSFKCFFFRVPLFFTSATGYFYSIFILLFLLRILFTYDNFLYSNFLLFTVFFCPSIALSKLVFFFRKQFTHYTQDF